MHRISLSLLLLASFLWALAQSKTGRELGKKLDDLIEPAYPSVAPGMVVLIAKKGTIIYEKAFGMASLELQAPMTKDMVFRVGSISKQYTAIAILQLAEQV
jgi:CubicO group peptidase (beta-lactamase class C family)